MYPRTAEMVLIFAAYDDRCPTNTFIAIFYNRVTKELKRRVQKQDAGTYELWYGHQVRYFSIVPSLEAQIVVHRKSSDEELKTVNNIQQPLRSIQKIIAEYSSELFHDHTNLTVIKSDFVKSSAFSCNDIYLEHCPCIVFYVLKKHIIPVGEKKLPGRIGDFVTDVREGIFEHLADNPSNVFFQ